MSIAIQNTNPQTDTFAGLVDRTNQGLYVISTYAVTTALTANGGVTIGNASIQGIFSANTLTAAQELRGGTVAIPAPLVITSNLVSNSALTTLTSNNIFGGTNTTITSNAVFSGLTTFNNVLNASNTVNLTANTNANNINATRAVVQTLLFNNASSNGVTSINTLTVAGVASFNNISTFSNAVNLNALTTANILNANTLGANSFTANTGTIVTFYSTGATITSLQVNTLGVVSGLTALSATITSNLTSNNISANTGVFRTAGANTFTSNNNTFGNVSVVGALTAVTANFSGNVVTGNVQVNGNLNITGTLTYSQTSYSDIIPNGNTYSLGNTSNRWNLLGTSGNFSNNLTVTGQTTLANTLVLGNRVVLNLVDPTIVVNRGSSANSSFGWHEGLSRWLVNGTSGLVVEDFGLYSINVSGSANSATTASNAINLNGQAPSYYLNYNNLANIPATFAPSAHIHSIAQITNLQTILDTKAQINAPTFTNATLFTESNNTVFITQGGLELYRTDGAPFIDFKNDPSHDFDARIQLIGSNLAIGVPGNITINGSGVWHSGNFNPNSIAASALTGTISNDRLSGSYNITANNATYLNGQLSSYYQNASNMNAGTLSNDRLSGTYNINISGLANVAANLTTGADNYYRNVVNHFGIIPSDRLSGSYNITATNATNLNGQAQSFYQNASNINAGTLADARLPSSMSGNKAFIGAPQIRLKLYANNSGVGSLLYTDTNNFHVLFTNNNDADGSFNGLRPFIINLNSGDVTMAHNVTISGSLNANIISASGNINSSGTIQGATLTTPGNIGGNNISISNQITAGGNIYGANLYASSSIFATGNITGYNTSDKNLKKNIKKFTNALEIVSNINGYEFDWNKKGTEIVGREGYDTGVIAQEIETVLPNLVGVDKRGYKYIKNGYNTLIPVLIEAIKELNNKVTKLEARC